MADHLDAPGLMSPNANAKTDITDIYAFQKPGDPDTSILILNVNPLAPTLATEFESNGLYQLKIDTDGDALAEIAFRIQFSPVQNGKQWATVRRDVGNRANKDQNTGTRAKTKRIGLTERAAAIPTAGRALARPKSTATCPSSGRTAARLRRARFPGLGHGRA